MSESEPCSFERDMVYIDIETMATSAGAVVYELGVLRFSGYPHFEEKAGEVYLLHTKDQGARKIDADTVCWMGKTEGRIPALQRAMKEGLSVREVYGDLQASGYFKGRPLVWCRGTDFDIAILRNLFEGIEAQPPWHWGMTRDFRTILKVADWMGIEEYTKDIPHDALGDCRADLAQLGKVLRRLKEAV
jgi:hypothetical protein